MPESVTKGRAPETEPEAMPSMSFLDHLEELRKRIFHSLIAVACGMGVCWWYHEALFGFMQKPIMQTLKRQGIDRLGFLTPTEPFNLYLKVSPLAGLFVSAPSL